MFQFKQYEDDTAATRSRALSDYTKEATAAFKSVSNWDVFFFLTSVSFSATPGTGLFDRVAKATAALSKRFRRDAVFWDANALLNIILPSYPEYAPFFDAPGTAYHPQTIVIVRDTSSATLAVTEVIAERAIADARVSELLPENTPILGPASTSPLWILADAARWRTLHALTRRASVVLKKRRKPDMRLVRWLSLIRAWAEAQTGQPRIALRRLASLANTHRVRHDVELAAWIQNVRAISFGKLAKERDAEISSELAATLAQECGNYWLAHTVAMRLLHRRSWNAWEHGDPLPDAEFDARVGALESWFRYADASQRDSMIVTRDIVTILHHSWRPQLASVTQAGISRLLPYPGLPVDELARLTSEYGRIALHSTGDATTAIEWLKRAVVVRVATGHKPRLRYDLTWLAEAYVLSGNPYFARACALGAERVHEQLYGRVRTDTTLVMRIESLIRQTASAGAQNLWHVLDLATGVPEAWWRIELGGTRERMHR